MTVNRAINDHLDYASDKEDSVVHYEPRSDFIMCVDKVINGARTAPPDKQLQETTTMTAVPRTPQRKRGRGGGVLEEIVREAEQQSNAAMSEGVRSNSSFTCSQAARHTHENAGLADHPAAAGDTAEGGNSGEGS